MAVAARTRTVPRAVPAAIRRLLPVPTLAASRAPAAPDAAVRGVLATDVPTRAVAGDAVGAGVLASGRTGRPRPARARKARAAGAARTRAWTTLALRVGALAGPITVAATTGVEGVPLGAPCRPVGPATGPATAPSRGAPPVRVARAATTAAPVAVGLPLPVGPRPPREGSSAGA